jgi:hypothetical protein
VLYFLLKTFEGYAITVRDHKKAVNRCYTPIDCTQLSKFGVNFINIIGTNFSYKRHFSSYVLALLKNLYEKRARITLMKLTIGGANMNENEFGLKGRRIVSFLLS